MTILPSRCLIWTACAALIPLALAQISVPPSHSYGMVGRDVNLMCQVTNPNSGPSFEWYEYTSANNVANTIYWDPPSSTPFDSTQYNVSGKYDLTIKSVNIDDDAGYYGCKVYGMASASLAHVFVIQEPVITLPSNVKIGDKVVVKCDVKYSGSSTLSQETTITTPVVTMELRGNTLPISTIFSNFSTARPWTITVTANITAQKDHDKANLTCSITLQQPIAVIKYGKLMSVQFAVEQPVFIPEASEYRVGDQLNCSAPGNPTPLYRWTAIESPLGPGSEVIGPYLPMTDEMIGANNWECEATNSIGNTPHSAKGSLSFNVVPQNPGEVKPAGVEAWKVAVGICVPLAIIAIVVGVVVGLHFHKKKKRAADYASKIPPPEIGGTVNPGVDGEKANGKPLDTNAARVPISTVPDPMSQDNPINRSRDSPGYADLGIKQITGSYPGMDVSVNSSFDEHEPAGVNYNPAPNNRQAPPPDRGPVAPTRRNVPVGGRALPGMANPQGRPQPDRYVNASFEHDSPPPPGRPNNLNIRPNHPDTFV